MQMVLRVRERCGNLFSETVQCKIRVYDSVFTCLFTVHWPSKALPLTKWKSFCDGCILDYYLGKFIASNAVQFRKQIRFVFHEFLDHICYFSDGQGVGLRIHCSRRCPAREIRRRIEINVLFKKKDFIRQTYSEMCITSEFVINSSF